MSRYIDVSDLNIPSDENDYDELVAFADKVAEMITDAPSIDIVFCENCRKSHIDGKTTHHLWCTEWGRSTDPFGYCERGEREGE